MDDKKYFDFLNSLFHYRFPEKLDLKPGELKDDIGKKFDDFQKNFGLLQFYIYTTEIDSTTGIKFSPWIDNGKLVPWEDNETIVCKWYKDWHQEVNDEFKQQYIEGFRKNRELNLAPPEFLDIFSQLFDAKGNAPLLEEEKENCFLLVSDGEQSLYSFLYMLCPERKILWETPTDLFVLLGFADKASHLTYRFSRMLSWVKNNSLDHPALSLPLFPILNAADKKTLGNILSSLFNTADFIKKLEIHDIQGITNSLIQTLKDLRFEVGGTRYTIFSTKENFLNIPTIRFNVEGEFKLRENEEISRNFFATPLMYIKGEDGALYSTFAVGTILDLEDIREVKNIHKIQKLKFAINELSRKKADKNFLAALQNTNEKLLETVIETRRHAAKAAISQVMARNMSHNIGSHVLSKFKTEEDISKPILSQYKSFLGHKTTETLPLVATFNEYLKNRMDYLADIATSDPVMENIMEFKTELMTGIDKNRALLDRISGVSDEKLNFEFILKQNGGTIVSDLSLSIPNDILGAHAFYIILENIIRNIAKHSKLQDDEKQVKITTDISDFKIDNKSTEFFEVSIYDNVCRKKSDIEKIVLSRNQSFNTSIIKNGVLRDNNLGTIEMDVCAAYLRCLPITSIELPEYDLAVDELTGHILNNIRIENPLLMYTYFQQGDSPENGFLGYKFFLNKPKEVLVVDDDDTFKIAKLNAQQLINQGIRIIKSTEITSNAIYNHQFLYCQTALEIIEKNYPNIPKRVVDKIENVQFETPLHFIAKVWEKYICKKIGSQFPFRIAHIGTVLNLNKTVSNTLIESSTNENPYTVLIDWNHADNYEKAKDYSYYDMSCSHHKLNKYLDDILAVDEEFDGNLAIKRKSEYLEVITSSIVVIDERIQEGICNQNKKYSYKGISFPFHEYFHKQNIFIPTKEDVDLNQSSFGEMHKSGDVSDNLMNYIHTSEKCNVDFFIIHLGVIEKMLPTNIIKSEPEINKIIDQLFHDIDRKKIVVTSGRGNPNNLPDDIAFVPIALIQNALETSFDKILLTKILYNSRTSKKQ